MVCVCAPLFYSTHYCLKWWCQRRIEYSKIKSKKVTLLRWWNMLLVLLLLLHISAYAFSHLRSLCVAFFSHCFCFLPSPLRVHFSFYHPLSLSLSLCSFYVCYLHQFITTKAHNDKPRNTQCYWTNKFFINVSTRYSEVRFSFVCLFVCLYF